MIGQPSDGAAPRRAREREGTSTPGLTALGSRRVANECQRAERNEHAGAYQHLLHADDRRDGRRGEKRGSSPPRSWIWKTPMARPARAPGTCS